MKTCPRVIWWCNAIQVGLKFQKFIIIQKHNCRINEQSLLSGGKIIARWLIPSKLMGSHISTIEAVKTLQCTDEKLHYECTIIKDIGRKWIGQNQCPPKILVVDDVVSSHVTLWEKKRGGVTQSTWLSKSNRILMPIDWRFIYFGVYLSGDLQLRQTYQIICKSPAYVQS